MSDCRTCKHNTYLGLKASTGWVDCCHPKTLAKVPKVEPGDPAWVNFMTADRTIESMKNLLACGACEAWEDGNA